MRRARDCSNRPPDWLVCVKRCPDLNNQICGVEVRDPQSLVARQLDDVVNPPRCTTDPHLHVIYAFPNGRPDATPGITPQIRNVMNRSNARLFRDGRESSGGWIPAEYRVLCDATGETAVQTVFMPGIDAADVGDPNTLYFRIVQAVQAAGHTSTDDKYVVFGDVVHPNACGQGDVEQTRARAAPTSTTTPRRTTQ